MNGLEQAYVPENTTLPISGIFELRSGGIIEPVLSGYSYTPRVDMRILLHKHGFCNMFACVVAPDTTLTLSDFHSIRALAEAHNNEAGIRYPVDKLVIRSRDSLRNGIAKLGGTNPMAFVSDAGDYFPRLSGKDRWGKFREYPTVSMWEYFAINREAYYLIHAEQEAIQRKTVHGRACVLNDGSWELSVGGGVNHAREIGENGYPFFSVVGHNLEFMLESIDSGGAGVGLGLKANTDMHGVQKLARSVLPYTQKIYDARNLVDGKFGNGHTLEFRIMLPNSDFPDMLDDVIHIYDADRILGHGGVTTMSGMRPSEGYLLEISRNRDA